MTSPEFAAPHHVTVGYEGEPGARTFYFQVEDDDRRVTVILEKSQVAGIVQLLQELLAATGLAPSTDWDRTAMALRAPVDPQWRVGDIGVGVDDDDGQFVLEFHPRDTMNTEVALISEVSDDVLHVRVDPDQARRLAAHAEEQVTQGRPPCPLCGRPLNRDQAHVCPSTNGHGALSQ